MNWEADCERFFVSNPISLIKPFDGTKNDCWVKEKLLFSSNLGSNGRSNGKINTGNKKNEVANSLQVYQRLLQRVKNRTKRKSFNFKKKLSLPSCISALHWYNLISFYNEKNLNPFEITIEIVKLKLEIFFLCVL